MRNYVITTTLPESFGGRTKALLKRTRLLNEALGTDFILVTTNNNPNYQEIYESYIRKGYIQPETTFLNIYDDLIPKPFPKKKVKHKVKERGYKSEKLKKRNAYKYKRKGIYMIFKSFEYDDGSLKFIDYIRENTTNRKFRDFYNKKGYRYRRFTYDKDLNVVKEELYDGKGKIYLSKDLTILNGSNQIKKITLYENYRFKDTKEFESENEFFAYWYEKILEENSNVICDARKIDEALMKVNKPINKIFQIHSTLKSINAKNTGARKYIVQKARIADNIVFLTDKQKNDFKEETGVGEEQLATIPHFIEYPTIKKNYKDKNKLSVVSRLDPDKQIDHIIKAYKPLPEVYQGIKLFIYGDGKDETRLKKLIKQEGLEKSVVLNGRTEVPDEVFQESAFSIFASKHEGFGLVVLESLNNGCPVVSYDTEYGPSDMIKHGENGFLVKPNDINDLESKMKAMIEADIDKKAENAKNLEEKFRKETYIQSWEKILHRG